MSTSAPSRPLPGDVAAGDGCDADHIVRCHQQALRDFLTARWPTPRLRSQIDDALQEVLLSCFRPGGAMQRFEQRSEQRGGGRLRAFLLGVTRNVARRFEQTAARRHEQSEGRMAIRESVEPPRSEPDCDRLWERAMLVEAAQRVRCREGNGAPDVDFDLLLLDQHAVEGLSLRELARRHGMPFSVLQRRFVRIRREVAMALRWVVERHHRCEPLVVEREWRTLLGSAS